MVSYGLNKINLAFDAQYKIVILTLLISLLSGLGLGFVQHDFDERCRLFRNCRKRAGFKSYVKMRPKQAFAEMFHNTSGIADVSK